MGWKVMLKVLRRSGLVPVLVMAQVVFALVVLVNVGSMLATQMAPVLAPTGVPAREVLLTRQVSSGAHPWSHARISAAEQAVRAVPGVTAVSAGLGAPFTADGLQLAIKPTSVAGHRTTRANVFSGDHVVQTLGLKILRGRDFVADDYVRGGFGKMMSGARVALITASLARQLFPNRRAIGQLIRMTPATHGRQDPPLQVIGIVNDTLRSAVMKNGPTRMHNVVLTPFQADAMPMVAFMVRTTPARRDAVMKRLPKVLGHALGLSDSHGITVTTYEDARDAMLHGHRLMAWMLAAVLVTVSIVVLLGIAGLSGFWMQSRVHSLGVRRALGARRVDILRDCQFENLLMVGVGVLIGVGLGVLAAAWLRTRFELDMPSIATWAVGALVLLVFGQLAVLAPALRAARVPPVVATRSV